MRITKMKQLAYVSVVLLAATLWVSTAHAGGLATDTELDHKVQKFLEKNESSWRDMNIPYSDGRVLYDLIVENNYKHALEIGTSTGHSGIWSMGLK